MRFFRNLLLVLFPVCLTVVALLRADDEKKSPPKIEPWTAEDIINTETIPQFRISPDGKWLAFTKLESDKEKDARISNIFLSSTTENREIQLTRGADTNSSFAWSPDGEWIAFLSTKARTQAKPDTAHTQIWLINPHGGEPYPLTDLVRAPHQLAWLDKDTIIFSAEEDPSAYEQAQKKKKDDSEVVDDADHEPPVRLFKITVKDKKITRLTNNSDWIRNWSRRKMANMLSPYTPRACITRSTRKFLPSPILHNLTDGTEKQIFTEGRIRPYEMEWTPDSTGFYLTAPFSTDPKFITASITLLYFYDVASGKGSQVGLDWENGVGSSFAVTSEGFSSAWPVERVFISCATQRQSHRHHLEARSTGRRARQKYSGV